MGNLEHNIKEAFATQDSKTKLADKDVLWNRLDNKMHASKGVAAFWRVAVVFLGFLLFTGAFAALNKHSKQQNKLETVMLENERMEVTIDSLLLLPSKVQTEIQILEKEKIVYREKPVVQQNSNSEQLWIIKYKQLADSSNLVLANKENTYKQEIKQLNEQLEDVKQELVLNEEEVKSQSESKRSAPFELKSDRVEVEVSKKPTVKTPEMEMKVFQKNFIENRNNLNSTIFKK